MKINMILVPRNRLTLPHDLLPQVNNLFRKRKPTETAVRIGPVPRSWFIPDSVFKEGKKLPKKPKPLFPGSGWMKMFERYGALKKTNGVVQALIYMIELDSPHCRTVKMQEKGAVVDIERPQCYLVVDYEEEDATRSRRRGGVSFWSSWEEEEGSSLCSCARTYVFAQERGRWWLECGVGVVVRTQ